MRFKELDLNDTETKFKIIDLETGEYLKIWSAAAVDGCRCCRRRTFSIGYIINDKYLFKLFMGDSIDRYEFIKE